VSIPGPTVPKIGFVWCKHVEKSTGKPFAKLSPIQLGQLKIITNELGPATLAVIEYAAQNWDSFGAQVVSQTGYPAAPSSPSIGFLCKHRQIALTLAYNTALAKASKSPCEWTLIKTYPALVTTSVY
jgi:hypothetical protein